MSNAPKKQNQQPSKPGMQRDAREPGENLGKQQKNQKQGEDTRA